MTEVGEANLSSRRTDPDKAKDSGHNPCGQIVAAKTLSQWMENQIPIGLSHDALLFEGQGDATL
jgi:hypothetical protein